MKICPVILAGGFGRRLAPVSTPYQPKQFHDLLGCGETLIQSTIKRALMFAEPEDVITVANAVHEVHVEKQLAEINQGLLQGVIYEDEPRNTAYAISLALEQVADDSILLIMPSDHFINGNFFDDAENAIELAQKGKIVTFGIMPEYPSTNFGYLLQNTFIEKPDYATAVKLLRSGALWNSGIFVAKASVIREEFTKYHTNFSLYYPFDKAVMEKTKKMEVIPAQFNWDDLGNWESLEKYLKGSSLRLAS